MGLHITESALSAIANISHGITDIPASHMIPELAISGPTVRWVVDIVNRNATEADQLVTVSGIEISVPWKEWLTSHDTIILDYVDRSYKLYTADGKEVGFPR